MQNSASQLRDRLLQALDQDNNVVDMAATMEVIALLEKTPVTREILETTRLGKYVNEMRRKTTNEMLARRAKSLLRQWRKTCLNHQNGLSSEQSVGNLSSRNHKVQGSPGSPGRSLPSSTCSSPAFPISRPETPSASMGGKGASSSVSLKGRIPPMDPTFIPTIDTWSQERTSHKYASNKRLRKDNPPENDFSPPLPKKPHFSVLEIESDVEPLVNGTGTRAVSLPVGLEETSRDSFYSDKSDTKVPGAVILGLRKKGSRRKMVQQTDVLLEKFQYLQRSSKVKTTEELVQQYGSPLKEKPANENVMGRPGRPVDPAGIRDEMMHKWLEAQSSEEHVTPEVEIIEEEPSRSPPSPCPPPPPCQTSSSVDKILSRLPPLDYDAIQSYIEKCEEERAMEEEEKPEPVPVTAEAVQRLHSEEVPNLNGNQNFDGEFRQWHQAVSVPSYNGDLLHILPYVVID